MFFFKVKENLFITKPTRCTNF